MSYKHRNSGKIYFAWFLSKSGKKHMAQWHLYLLHYLIYSWQRAPSILNSALWDLNPLIRILHSWLEEFYANYLLALYTSVYTLYTSNLIIIFDFWILGFLIFSYSISPCFPLFPCTSDVSLCGTYSYFPMTFGQALHFVTPGELPRGAVGIFLTAISRWG